MDTYGVIGWPIKHSLSPAMHNAAFKALGIEAKYEKFEVKPEDLEDFLLNRKDVKGFNITVPHKVRAKEILERNKNTKGQYYVDLCGAVNTVKRVKNDLEYANTDVLGFLTSLKEDLKFSYAAKNIILIGCGGAGRAVIAGLTYGDKTCKKIYVYDNNVDAIKSVEKLFSRLKDRLEVISDAKISALIKSCQLLVNASPLGMKQGDTPVIDKELLHKDLSIYDVVYNRETELLKESKSLGLHAVGGLGMLLYQGVHAFEFWTGKQAPVDVMREALDKAIK